MQAEEGLKSFKVALLKPAQDAVRLVLHPPFPLYLCLRVRQQKGYILRTAEQFFHRFLLVAIP
jgi:hypothetical protein